MEVVTKRFKSALKPFVPKSIIEKRRRAIFEREQNAARGKPLEEVFTEIYETSSWGVFDNVRYHSGPGSEAGVTAEYEDFVVRYLAQHPDVKTLVDIGCGDFQVSKRILGKLSRPVKYTGCDIAANVVAYNTAHHGVPGQIDFLHLDVSQKLPPAGDVVTVREVLQHLSNATIASVLTNLRARFDKAIITECVFDNPSAPNLDIVSGYRTRDGLRSGVYLDLPPYKLEVLDRYETKVREDEIIRTLVVKL